MENERYQSYSFHANGQDEEPTCYSTECRGGVYSWVPDDREKASTLVRRKKRHSHSLGLIASLLSVALIFAFIGAFGMRSLMLAQNGREQAQEQAAKPAARENEALKINEEGALQKPYSNEAARNQRHMSVYAAAVKSSEQNKEPLSIMDIAKVGKPFVVAITTEQRQNFGFFTQSMPVAGSGFLISEDGYIATNNHVIENGRNIQVRLDGDKFYDAKIVGRDPLSDLAVIKIEAKDGEKFPYAKWGDSSKLVVGELAVAIGNPAGILEGSVTAGIISALEREINVGGTQLKVLQTDASINSGNSGGALFNSFGEVIGVNTAKLNNDGGGQSFDGIAFAIPSNVARPVLESLMKVGYVQDRVFFGFSGQGLDSDYARYYKLADRPGVLLTNVVKGSSADEAGLRANDFVVEIDGHSVDTISAIQLLKQEMHVGDEVKVVYYRFGKKAECTMKLKAEEHQNGKQNPDEQNPAEQNADDETPDLPESSETDPQ